MAVFYNQATLRYTGGSINSNIISGEVLEPVTVSKTAVSDSYAPGGAVTYVVSVANSGPVPVTGVTVTDDLGGYKAKCGQVYPLQYVEGSLLYYVDGLRQPCPAVTAGPPLTVTGLTVPAGDSVMLIYEARVTCYAPLGECATIENTVTVTGTGGCFAGPITASATVPMEMGPMLSIAKSVSPQVVTGCGEITYTFVIQNAGGSAAGLNVVVTDTFDPVLRELVVTLDGNTLPASAYTYDVRTGAFATAPGAICVPAATFSRDCDGCWAVNPGVTVLTVTGVM